MWPNLVNMTQWLLIHLLVCLSACRFMAWQDRECGDVSQVYGDHRPGGGASSAGNGFAAVGAQLRVLLHHR